MRKVFISATSRDLKSYRLLVAEWARTRGYQPIFEDEIPVQSDYQTILQMLRDKIAPCDAVIHLAGLWYGSEPTNVPQDDRRRSYTQLEYDLAKDLRRQVFRYIARPDYATDQPIIQDADQRDLQLAHRERLMVGSEKYSAECRTSGNELYYEFSTHEELQRLLDNIEIRETVAKPISKDFGTIGTLFKGREEFLERIRQALTKKSTQVIAVTATQAIHGLGGIGKTRAAIEYGWKHQHEYSALLFVTADSPANLDRNLAGLCDAQVLNLPEQHAQEQAAQVAAAIRWLREHAGWFLVLDNVDTEEAATAADALLSRMSGGHVVITSRLARWGTGVEKLDLGVLDHESAAQFLLERTAGHRQVTPTDNEDAGLLAQDLDGLALALEQAGAFIVDRAITLANYRARWKQQDAKVFEWFNAREMHYPRSVATTWQTSVDQLSHDGRELLKILCWLAPDPIPRDMLQHLTPDSDSSGLDVEAGIAGLVKYSLARWDLEHQTIQVHRLVEEITRYRIPESERKDYLLRALGMLDCYFPAKSDDVRFWPACQVARPHCLGVAEHLTSFGSPFPTSRLLSRLARHLYARAEHRYAEPLMRRALAIDEQSYGPDHPEVAIRLNNLAQVLKATNRLAEAEPLMRRVLAIDEQTYGPDHPDIAVDLSNLAQLLQDTNRLAEAEPLMRRSLVINEQTYGPDHPRVSSDLSNLATLLQDTNRLVEAEPLMRRSLVINEQSYGPDHPRVSSDLNNLATLLQDTNRLVEAEPLMRRSLAINEQCYGPDHPTVAIRLSNLATLLQATNRLVEAEPLMQRQLQIFCKFTHATGYQHPHLVAAVGNYWGLLKAMNVPEAEMLQRVIDAGFDPAWLNTT